MKIRVGLVENRKKNLFLTLSSAFLSLLVFFGGEGRGFSEKGVIKGGAY